MARDKIRMTTRFQEQVSLNMMEERTYSANESPIERKQRITKYADRMRTLYDMTGVSRDINEEDHLTVDSILDSMVKEGYQSVQGIRVMKKGRKFRHHH